MAEILRYPARCVVLDRTSLQRESRYNSDGHTHSRCRLVAETVKRRSWKALTEVRTDLRRQFSSCDLELRPMTLTFESDL